MACTTKVVKKISQPSPNSLPNMDPKFLLVPSTPFMLILALNLSHRHSEPGHPNKRSKLHMLHPNINIKMAFVSVITVLLRICLENYWFMLVSTPIIYTMLCTMHVLSTTAYQSKALIHRLAK